MKLVAYVAVYVTLSTTGLVLLRLSLSQPGRGMVDLLRDPRLSLGAVFYAASFLSWLAALRVFALTTLYPIITGVGYCAVLLAAVVFLGERVSAGRIGGIALVGIGVLLIAR